LDKDANSLGDEFNSFMNLIATMILPKPSLRLSLAEIKMHPWYNEKVATEDEVIKEMRRR